MNDRYLILDCPRCKELIIADSRYKNKTCPKCSAKISLEDVKAIRTAKDAREARTIVSEAKAHRGGLD